MRATVVLTALAAFGLLGSVSHGEEKKLSPNNQAVQANNQFACDLYRQLADDNKEKNVFFSPYSISSALAMTLEGAREKTALEMGKVLRLPKALHTENAERPWSLEPYHEGFNALNRSFNARTDSLKDKAPRAKLAGMRDELKKLNTRVAELQKGGNFNQLQQLSGQAQKLADSINKLQQEVDQYEVRIANAIWAEKTYPFDPNYFDAISKYYGSDTLRGADFIGNFPAERGKINGWVEEKTNDRIKDLIPNYPPEFAARIRMILVNAIYFKGQWASPFDEKRTKTEDFVQADGGKAKVPMMQDHIGEARYAAFNADGTLFNTPTHIPFEGGKVAKYPEGDGFLMVEMPVKGERLSFVAIAPQKVDGLPALEGKLTGTTLTDWIGKLQRRAVNVEMPRFKLETEYSLTDVLKKLGMQQAFEERAANFTAMSKSRNPDDNLSIAAVLHKAFVEVNEKGAEAAAATAVIMAVPTSAVLSTPFTPTFRADRPFIFLIRDMDSGAILFLGRFQRPA